MAKLLAPVDGRIKLAKIDPNDTLGISDQDAVAEAMQNDLQELYNLHYLMFAENRRALVIVLQGIDASGKDGLLRHVASGLNPQGTRVHSFKKPNDEELEHDYLWRVHRAMPGRGEIAIFNRSHYEEVTVVKVHPEILQAQNLPEELARPKSIFKRRYRQINAFERMLSENGTIVLKFLLHISRDEQEKRFEERLTDPRKHWKFTKQDILERQHWPAYMEAFEEMVENTSTDYAPWFVVPANHKWFRNYVVTNTIVRTLAALNMTFPTLHA